MSLAIVSPHLDDAAFSVGEHMLRRSDVTVVCPLAGVPEDDAGCRKYETLHAEHIEAMRQARAHVRNGPFFDDCYPPLDGAALTEWLADALRGFDEVWLPVGIHHPDHIRVSDCSLVVLSASARLVFYEELPYRVLYPVATAKRFRSLVSRRSHQFCAAADDIAGKSALVRAYASQHGGDVLRCCLAPERLWCVR